MWLASCSTVSQFNTNKPLDVLDGVVQLERSPMHYHLGPGKILFIADLPKEKTGWLNYWRDSEPDKRFKLKLQQADFGRVYAHVDGLTPGAKYNWQIKVNDKLTRIFNFKIAPKKAKTYRFHVIGDSRPGSEIAHRKVVSQMAKRNADFYIHLGDFVNYGSHFEDWREFFDIEGPLLKKMPIVPVIGNHDLSFSHIFRKMFVFDQWVAPGRRYFTYRYADSVFIVLDSNIPMGSETEQGWFLLRELEKAKTQNAKHIFVNLHHPLWSSSRKHGSSQKLQRQLAPLFKEYGVTAVFSGHDHHYERLKPIDGVTYIVTGGGGSPLRPVKKISVSAQALVTYHFLEVDVSEDAILARAIDKNGKVIDEFQIR